MATLTGPVTQTERIDSLDVLRGFALLGILVMNIVAFSMPFSAYVNPTSFGDMTGANYWVWFFSHLLFDQKFMTIFSMLFGAGIIIFTTRAAERGRSPAAMHYRRTFWLLLIGAVHAYLLWWGDILVLYAMCALIIYPARKLSPKLLLPIGLALLLTCSGIYFLAGSTMPQWPPEVVAEMSQGWKPSPEKLDEEIAAYTGPWSGQLSHRVPLAFQFHTFVFFIWGFWRAAGLMLIGMALYKLGVFNATCSRRFYAMLAALALVGFALVYTGVRLNEASQWDMYFSFFKGVQFNYWGSVLVSTAYIGLMMLFCQSASGGWLKGSLRAVGQMAFTNYLMHTLICIMIFYGPGLGLFAQVNRVGQIGIVLVIWVAQLIYSPIWLRHFRFGPFEWLWRSLTYWQLQPMRRAEPTVATAAAS
ncbi:MAG: DUF418 domain-containing protein [Candidatus Acidiferrales bacterium]